MGRICTTLYFSYQIWPKSSEVIHYGCLYSTLAVYNSHDAKYSLNLNKKVRKFSTKVQSTLESSSHHDSTPEFYKSSSPSLCTLNITRFTTKVPEKCHWQLLLICNMMQQEQHLGL